MFRPGQFAQCIDASNSDGELILGAIYPVAAVYGRFLAIEHGRLNGWYVSRFRPAPSIEGLRQLLQPISINERV